MPELQGAHIVAAYDAELKTLTRLLARMGGLAERQLANALQAVERRDDALALEVRQGDAEIDEIEREIEGLVMRMLALRQPMANDLRYVISTLRTSSDIERIGDYAKNIAKRALALNQLPAEPSLRSIPRVAKPVQAMLKNVMDAALQGDTEKAIDVWEADEEVDALYTGLFRELLTYMMEDPRHITPSTHLLFIAKNLERIGDHATNIAETVHYQIEGTPLSDRRQKADATSYEVIRPSEEDFEDD